MEFLNSTTNKDNFGKRLLSLSVVPEDYQLECLKQIAHFLSNSNYNSFSSYVSSKRNPDYSISELRDRLIKFKPMDCFEFAFLFNQILPDLGFKNIEIYGANFSSSPPNTEFNHTAIIINNKYILDPYNNFKDLVEIKENEEFQDKRGRRYLISLSENGFSLTYNSSTTNQLKTVEFNQILESEIELTFKKYIEEDMWKILYASHGDGNPKWLTYDSKTGSFNSNVEILNQPVNLNHPEEFYRTIFKEFQDYSLVRDVKFLIEFSN